MPAKGRAGGSPASSSDWAAEEPIPSGSIGVVAAEDANHRDFSQHLVDAVKHPVGSSLGVSIVQRRAKLLANPAGVSSSGPTMNSYAANATGSGSCRPLAGVQWVQ